MRRRFAPRMVGVDGERRELEGVRSRSRVIAPVVVLALVGVAIGTRTNTGRDVDRPVAAGPASSQMDKPLQARRRRAAASSACTPGHADLSFGAGGWVSAPVAGLAAVLSDGRIAALGQTSDRYDSYRLGILSRTGAPVPGSTPVRVRSPAGPLTQIGQAITDSHDRLLLPGGVGRAPAYSRPILLRRTNDGRPDRSFGRAGTVTLARSNEFRYGAFTP
jgi:hypothetical protein